MKENLEKKVTNRLNAIHEENCWFIGNMIPMIASGSFTEKEVLSRSSKMEVVIQPFQCVDIAQEVAEAMIDDVLSKNYGIHNIASNKEVLAKNISNGLIKPFLKFDKNKNPIACAALVKINETDIELGRAACVPGLNGGNGELMIKAFEEWKNNNFFPESKILRAEVRTAKPTKEVPGGQATQAICLNKIGFKPTAMVPMFHHGVPDRQEIFLLSSIIKDKNSQFSELNKPIPIEIGNETERKMFELFWNKFFKTIPNFINKDFGQIEPINLEAKISGPIIEIKKSSTPNNIDDAIEKFFVSDGRFALARIPLNLPTAEIISASTILKRSGFQLAGFEPIIKNDQLSIDILFGKLSEIGKRLMVLPSFIEKTFNQNEEEVLINNSILWRQL